MPPKLFNNAAAQKSGAVLKKKTVKKALNLSASFLRCWKKDVPESDKKDIVKELDRKKQGIPTTSNFSKAIIAKERPNIILNKVIDGELKFEFVLLSVVLSEEGFKYFANEELKLVVPKLVKFLNIFYEHETTREGLFHENDSCLLLIKVMWAIKCSEATQNCREVLTKSAILLHQCIELVYSKEGDKFFRLLKIALGQRDSLNLPVSQHENMLGHINYMTHNYFSQCQNDMRLCLLNNVLLMDKKYKNDKSELLDCYMDALLKDVHQKYPLKYSNEPSTQVEESQNGHHAGEAKRMFSFYCKQLNSYVKTEGITFLPYLYLSASTIHASFAEHFVRVLWECFRFENSAMAMYWLVGFMCNTADVVGFPLVKDTLRHLSVYLCMILKRTNLTPQSKKEESHECPKDRLNFVAGFYAMVALFVRYKKDLTGTSFELAFVKSLRFDRLLCCLLYPIQFLPEKLLSEFLSVVTTYAAIFPNPKFFLGDQVYPLDDEERSNLYIGDTKLFTSYDLQKSKWAISKYLRQPQEVIPSKEVASTETEKDSETYCIKRKSIRCISGNEEDELSLYASFISEETAMDDF